MTFPRYPDYKDSGVEWLGEVPAHWETCALKRVVSMKSGDTITSENIEESGEFPVFGGNGLRGYTNSYTHDGTYALIGRQGALCGNINYAQGKFWASEHAVVVSPLQPVETFWLGELLRSMNLNQYSISAAQPGLSVEIVGNLRIPLPPATEQQKIAVFLDRETTKIDTLIAEQQRLIELLKEKRQAVISHAVTKGLNPNAPMKNSGIEWLGKVPAHWEIKRLKHIKDLSPNAFVDGPFGSNLKSEHFIDDGDAYVIESNFATQGRLELSELKTITSDHFETIRRSETKTGDIIVAKIGAQFGKASILPIIDKPAVVSGNSMKLTVNNEICETLWAYWQLFNLKAIGEIDLLVNGSAQPALSLGAMNELIFLLPSKHEQIEVSDFIDFETTKLDTLTAEAQRAIDLLKERRTALISAAVTGKIDVRHCQPHSD